MELYDRFQGWLQAPYEKAAAIADATFPDQQWDHSQKNALRHSLGTGLWTQRLGGTWLSGKAAQLLGQGHEALGIGRLVSNPNNHRQDTLTDLSNNAVGARMGQRAVNEESLINALTRMAQNARQQNPVPFGADDPGHLTYTQNKR